MPARVFPSNTGFREFERQLSNGLKFRRIYGVEFARTFRRLGLQAPRPRYGRETGFIFSANGLHAVVWTTWLERDGKFRDTDAGWVLIAQNDNAVYFTHPIHRTRNFLLTLLRHAWLAHWRVLHRPLCEEGCRGHLSIVQGKGLKSRYWRCNVCYAKAKTVEERKRFCADWDVDLPERAKQWVRALRRARERKRTAYREECRAKGVVPIPAVLRRRPWARGAPSAR